MTPAPRLSATPGFATIDQLPSETESGDLSDVFEGRQFRSTIDMAYHWFGVGC